MPHPPNESVVAFLDDENDLYGVIDEDRSDDVWLFVTARNGRTIRLPMRRIRRVVTPKNEGDTRARAPKPVSA